MENLCLKCPVRGKCCFFGILINGKRISTDHYCKWLNPNTGRCKIYKRRHKLNPDCLTIGEMLERATVPVECLYVEDKEEYRSRNGRRLYNVQIKEIDVKK